MLRFVIRHAKLADRDAVIAFYESAAHQFVADRPDAEMIKAIEDSSIVVIEELHPGNIVGAAAVFRYLDGAYAEIGAARVTSRAGGYDLERIMVHTLVLHTHLTDADDPLPLFFAVVSKDNARAQGLVRQSFQECMMPAALLIERSRCTGLALDPSQKQTFALSATGLRFHACDLLRIAAECGWRSPDSGVPTLTRNRRNRQTGAAEAATIELTVDPLSDFHQDVQRVCQADPGLFDRL